MQVGQAFILLAQALQLLTGWKLPRFTWEETTGDKNARHLV